MNKRVTGVGLIEGSSWTQEGHHKAIFGRWMGARGGAGLRGWSGQGSVTSSSASFFALLVQLLLLLLLLLLFLLLHLPFFSSSCESPPPGFLSSHSSYLSLSSSYIYIFFLPPFLYKFSYHHQHMKVILSYLFISTIWFQANYIHEMHVIYTTINTIRYWVFGDLIHYTWPLAVSLRWREPWPSMAKSR